MSTSPQQSDDAPQQGGDAPATAGPPAAGQAGQEDRRPSAAALVFGDPLALQTSDDTDRGWGGSEYGGESADLARFLNEKPPHHL